MTMDGSWRMQNARRRATLAASVIASVISSSFVLSHGQTPDEPTQPASTQPSTQSTTTQPTTTQPAATTTKPKLSGAALRTYVAEQLALLDSPSYRERELARFRIEQYPFAAITAILEAAPTATVNATAQQINLLDSFSTHPDIAISSAAYDVLKLFSERQGTVLASIAEKSIQAIEGENEMKAFEILTHAGVNVGHLDLSINGAQSGMFSADYLSLEIKSDSFRGELQTLNWIRFLKSVEVVSLEGPIVNAQLLELVAQMPGVKKILINDATLTPEDLLPLKALSEIQHLELTYMPVTDDFVPALCQLPLTQSLRLYGTNITEDGEQELTKQLDGLEIYRSNGGFLGIASPSTGEVVVTKVVRESAAHQAGIQLNDKIVEIQDKPIKNFTALRATLADFRPDEIVKVKVIRQVIDPDTMKLVPTEMVLTAVLGKQEDN